MADIIEFKNASKAKTIKAAGSTSGPDCGAAFPMILPKFPVADKSPGAALMRMQHVVECLRAKFAQEGSIFDESNAQRVLDYFQRRAAAGEYLDDEGDDEEFAIAFIGDHNQSLDWIFCGDPGVMIWKAAPTPKS
jgi:hypothetical protein